MLFPAGAFLYACPLDACVHALSWPTSHSQFLICIASCQIPLDTAVSMLTSIGTGWLGAGRGLVPYVRTMARSGKPFAHRSSACAARMP